MDFKFKNLKRPLLSSSTVLYWKKHLKNANFTIHFLLLKVRKTTAFYWKFTKIFIVKRWPNKFASSRKSQKVVYFTHIQLSCDDMRLVAKRWKTCVDLRTTKVNVHQRKWVAKWNVRWTQVENLCSDLRVRLASGFTRVIAISHPFTLSS